jgi:pyrroloquinoline quinone (PQQ) biosynthesis protein C
VSAAKTFLADLRREIEAHPGVNHLFLNRCATSPFARADYAVFAENHFPLVCVFTSYLERLLVRAPTSEAKLWLAKVLVDEYGEGSEGKDHATLYETFVRAAGGTPPPRVPEPAFAFIREHRRIVTEEPFLVGLGAVGPGHEWAIPKMFDAVIPGLRRAGFAEGEIGYFTLHVAQDEDHGAWLEEALLRFAIDDRARAEIRRARGSGAACSAPWCASASRTRCVSTGRARARSRGSSCSPPGTARRDSVRSRRDGPRGASAAGRPSRRSSTRGGDR